MKLGVVWSALAALPLWSLAFASSRRAGWPEEMSGAEVWLGIGLAWPAYYAAIIAWFWLQRPGTERPGVIRGALIVHAVLQIAFAAWRWKATEPPFHHDVLVATAIPAIAAMTLPWLRATWHPRSALDGLAWWFPLFAFLPAAEAVAGFFYYANAPELPSSYFYVAQLEFGLPWLVHGVAFVNRQHIQKFLAPSMQRFLLALAALTALASSLMPGFFLAYIVMGADLFDTRGIRDLVLGVAGFTPAIIGLLSIMAWALQKLVRGHATRADVNEHADGVSSGKRPSEQQGPAWFRIDRFARRSSAAALVVGLLIAVFWVLPAEFPEDRPLVLAFVLLAVILPYAIASLISGHARQLGPSTDRSLFTAATSIVLTTIGVAAMGFLLAFLFTAAVASMSGLHFTPGALLDALLLANGAVLATWTVQSTRVVLKHHRARGRARGYRHHV